MEEFFQNLPLAELTRIALNRRRVTPVAQAVFTARYRRRNQVSAELGFLDGEAPVVLTFPRHPKFYVAFIREATPHLNYELFLAPERRHDAHTALVCLGTLCEVSSAEDARSLLRLDWGELEDPYLINENGITQAVWTYPCQTIGEYLEMCQRLCYDDNFELFCGPSKCSPSLLRVYPVVKSPGQKPGATR